MELSSETRGASIARLRKRAACAGTRRVLAVVTALMLAGWLATAVSAQQYQADPINEALSKQGASMQAMAKGQIAFDAAAFDEYFTKYYFPAMTRFGEDDLGKLGALRYDLFRNYLWASQNEDSQSHLTDLAFTAMKGIATKPAYHPAVRYNAVLVIGMLDDKYGIAATGNQRPPKPLPAANDILVKLINVGIQGNPVVTPSLVVGALVGLERHAQYHESLKPAQIDAMTEAAITLASKDPPLAELDNKVAEWIRIEAATVLAKLGSVGTNNRVHDALIALLADNKLSLDGRCEVASLLGLINYKDAKVDGKVASEKLLQLALDAGQVCDKQAKAYQELSLGGGAGAAMGRERGGRGTYSSSGEPHNEYDRKTLLSRLGDLRKGLVVIKPLAPADRAATIDSVTSTMQKVIDGASNKDTTDLDVAESVTKMFAAIQAAVKGNPATAAKPAAEPF